MTAYITEEEKSPPGRHCGVAGCVCVCVVGGGGELLVVSGCLFAEGNGSQACNKMERTNRN